MKKHFYWSILFAAFFIAAFWIIFFKKSRALKLISQRPIYLIAHGVNKKSDISLALSQGANAIECDVRLKNCLWVIAHSNYDKSEDLIVWLQHINQSDVVLIIFDIKTPDSADEVYNLFAIVRKFIINPIFVLFSIAYFRQRWSFEKIAPYLGTHCGVAIDFSPKFRKIKKFFTQKLNIRNFWYGNGIYHIFPMMRLLHIMRKAKKVSLQTYIWTLKRPKDIQTALDVGINGIMVDLFYLQRSKQIITSNQLQLATLHDCPWE